MFEQVSLMNEAFGNPKGNYESINYERLEKQCRNILDEYNELMAAIAAKDPVAVRDAMCDVMVFTLGGYHFIGADANADMKAVFDSNMSKFVRDHSELAATEEKYRSLGVPYRLEGEFPMMRVRCTEDTVGTDGETYRANKILKSAGYHKPVFE